MKENKKKGDSSLETVCKVCGLPKDLCVCDTLDKEKTKAIRVYSSKAKFNKYVTVVEGIDKHQIKDLVKFLKRKLACGGSAKDNQIILQGDHKSRIKDLLIQFGYKEDVIEIE